jgi:hypothetical protein
MSVKLVELQTQYEEDPRFVNETIKIRQNYRERIKAWNCNSYSNQSINFNCPPPSPLIALSTNMDIEISLLCEITTNTPPNCYAYDNNMIKVKELAIYKLIDRIQGSINNCSITEKYASIINVLSKIDKFENQFCKCNVLQNEKNSSDENIFLKSKIEIILRAPLKIFTDNKIFCGVISTDFTIHLVDNINQIFLFDDKIAGSTINISGSKLYTKYITLRYEYASIMNNKNIVKCLTKTLFVHRLNTVNILKLGQIETIHTNMYQTANTPEKILIFAREINGKNRYFPIKQCHFSRNNYSGIMQGYSQEDLFLISKNNGLKCSWDDFSNGSIILLGENELFLDEHESSYDLNPNSFMFTVSIENIYEDIELKNIEVCVLIIHNSSLITVKSYTNYITGGLSRETIFKTRENKNTLKL